jgi:hypothetical protein
VGGKCGGEADDAMGVMMRGEEGIRDILPHISRRGRSISRG